MKLDITITGNKLYDSWLSYNCFWSVFGLFCSLAITSDTSLVHLLTAAVLHDTIMKSLQLSREDKDKALRIILYAIFNQFAEPHVAIMWIIQYFS